MTVSIVACGETAREWHKVKVDRSIGVNDAFKFGYATDDLLVANWPVKFPQHRLNIIKNSKPKNFYSSVDQWRIYFPNMIKIRLNSWDGHLYSIRKDELSHSQTSPFIATSLAYKLGAKNIILWGVEMINHNIFHKDNPQTKTELKQWAQLIDALDVEGVKVWLGSPGSALNLPIWPA